jgi:hypothetical protein
MSEPEDRLLSFVVGGKTIGANLERAIASGDVVRHADGKLELLRPYGQPPAVTRLDGYIWRKGDFSQPCVFLNKFMFRHVYGEAAVPFGCRDCYKVKVVSNSLRQLVAVKDLAHSVPASSKSGMEVNNSGNQHLYGSYFYFLGLDRARAAYEVLRAKIDKHSKLGAGIKMLIKRGCTNYERKCGPSDQYKFDPRQEEIERYLSSRFVADVRMGAKRTVRNKIQFLQWVRTAYRIGDDTYKDFTDGNDLHPSVVTYPPEQQAD